MPNLSVYIYIYIFPFSLWLWSVSDISTSKGLLFCFFKSFRLPVLAGTGALGTTYCPPYLTVDGSYHARPSGQTSSASALRFVLCHFLNYL